MISYIGNGGGASAVTVYRSKRKRAALAAAILTSNVNSKPSISWLMSIFELSVSDIKQALQKRELVLSDEAAAFLIPILGVDPATH